MYCSNCEKESNLTLCAKCQREFQEIEDQESLDNLAAQDDAEYESERDYYGEPDEQYEAYLKMGERDEAYDVHMDRWEMEKT